MKEMLSNKILAGLSAAQSARLAPLLRPVALSAGQRLSEAGETTPFVYFPANSIISCLAEMQDGRFAEIGMVGFEGVADVTALLGARPAAHSLNVSVPGSALRITRESFQREMWLDDGISRPLVTYAGEYIAQVSQRAACAVLHLLEQRVAVWLLLVADRLHSDVIEATHERIAQHLGVRRAGVGVVAAEMQATGAISYRRGSLRIKDRLKLEAIACECYQPMAMLSRPRPRCVNLSYVPFAQRPEDYRSTDRIANNIEQRRRVGAASTR